MGMTGAILPLQGCLVILTKFSSIQSKAKINTYTLQRRKEQNNTTLAKQKAETKFMGEMKPHSRWPDSFMFLKAL